jgi:cytoplasmic tRNA 2-thiolation protein 1
MKIGANKILTGHNADDIAETVYMNILRGDFFRLAKCVDIVTGGIEAKDDEVGLPRAKPFKYTYEKEIVMYAHFKKLDYFSTECIYSPNAYRGYVRELIKDLEKIRPSTIIDIIHSGESLKIDQSTTKFPKKMNCSRCGFVSSNELCKACMLLEGLNNGTAKEAMKRGKAKKVEYSD